MKLKLGVLGFLSMAMINGMGLRAETFDVAGFRYERNSETAYTVSLVKCLTPYAERVEIPSDIEYLGTWYSVTSISDNALQNCNMTEVSISESILEIGENAFVGCSSLKQVTLPSSLTEIKKGTFYGCSKLETISIPAQVHSIGESAFYNCSSLTQIMLPASLTAIQSGTFLGCSKLESVIIPNLVEEISGSAFAGCSGLSSVSFGSNLSSIGYQAFHGCVGLTTLNLPESLNRLYDGAFGNCTGLTSVTLPPSVTTVFGYPFSHCDNIIKGGYPDNIKCVRSWSGDNPFVYQYKPAYSDAVQTEVYGVSVSYPSEDAIMCNNVVYNKEKTAIWFVPYNIEENYVIPATVTLLGPHSFCHWRFNSIELPQSITEIGSNALSDCAGLTSVTIPNSVTSLGKSAFEGCNSLSKINWGNGIKKIGNRAFYNCKAITSVIIPNSVEDIGMPFGNCSSLIKCAYPDDLSNPFTNSNSKDCVYISYPRNEVEFEDGMIFGINKTSFLFMPHDMIGEYEIPSSVETIGTNAFKNCRNLTAVYIPDAVTRIEYGAFTGTGLTHLTIPKNVTYIGGFGDCAALKSVEFNAENCTYAGFPITLPTITFNEGVKIIPANCLKGNAVIGTVHIPSSVIEIKSAAFADCSSLASVLFDAEKCTISGSYDNPAFPKTLQSIVFGEGVKTIPKYCLKGNNTITAVIIPNSVEDIEGSAFHSCLSLKEIRVPNSVKRINSLAFYKCSALENVYLGSSLTNIGSEAFAKCSQIKNIETYSLIPPKIDMVGGRGSFDLEVRNNAALYVPEDSYEAYKTATHWKDFKNINKIQSSGIESNICNNPKEIVSLFNLEGCEVDAAYKGIIIVKYSDGTINKILNR